MDVGNGVLKFERTILSASIRPVNPIHASSTDQCDIFIFEVKGLAFLYHQVLGDLTSVCNCMFLFGITVSEPYK